MRNLNINHEQIKKNIEVIKECLEVYNGNLEDIKYYLDEIIRMDLETFNNALKIQDQYKREWAVSFYSARLKAKMYFYNLYFSLENIEGVTTTGETFNWIEKREYTIKKNEHNYYYFGFNTLEYTEPKINGVVNFNFVLDKFNNIIYTISSIWDKSKINNKLAEVLNG